MNIKIWHECLLSCQIRHRQNQYFVPTYWLVLACLRQMQDMYSYGLIRDEDEPCLWQLEIHIRKYSIKIILILFIFFPKFVRLNCYFIALNLWPGAKRAEAYYVFVVTNSHVNTILLCFSIKNLPKNSLKCMLLSKQSSTFSKLY